MAADMAEACIHGKQLGNDAALYNYEWTLLYNHIQYVPHLGPECTLLRKLVRDALKPR
jgi:hypothetical protein